MTNRPSNRIAPRSTQPQQFQAFMKNEAVLANINANIGDVTRTKRFVSSVISAVNANPALKECQFPTIVSAALLGETLNLSPSPQLGQYYLVPFKDKKNGVTNATFQLGYKGYIQLAIRSGQYKKINVLPIKEGELIRYNPLDEELEVDLIDDEYERENTPTIGYYAMFQTINGFKKAMYWSKRRMMAHAEKYSTAFKFNGGAEALKRLEEGKIPEKDLWKYSSFWFKDFDGMAQKTMLRQLISKWGQLSIDEEKAYNSDMTFTDEKTGEVKYFDNDPDVIPAEATETAPEPQTEPQPVEQPAKVERPSLL